MDKETVTIPERLVGVLTYFTFGMAGLIWIITCLVIKRGLKNFEAYHIYQSIFLSILLYVFSVLCNIVFGLMFTLPFIGNFAKKVVIFLAGTPIYSGLNYSIVNLAILALISYLAAGAILGKYSYFPVISDIIKSNLKGR